MAKFDPILAEIMFEVLFEHYGRVPEGLAERLAIKSHNFYEEEGYGVVVDSENV
jgi:hypothetical protein